MTNLAEEAANAVVRTVELSDVSAFRKKQRETVNAFMPDIEEQDIEFMRDIVRTHLENTAMSDWPLVKKEFDVVLEHLGMDPLED